MQLYVIISVSNDDNAKIYIHHFFRCYAERQKRYCFKSGNIPKNNGWPDSHQLCDSLMISTNFK